MQVAPIPDLDAASQRDELLHPRFGRGLAAPGRLSKAPLSMATRICASIHVSSSSPEACASSWSSSLLVKMMAFHSS
jgi:hypothetical protein